MNSSLKKKKKSRVFSSIFLCTFVVWKHRHRQRVALARFAEGPSPVIMVAITLPLLRQCPPVI